MSPVNMSSTMENTMNSPKSTHHKRSSTMNKTLDFDQFRKLSYPNIQVTPRYHMVIDKPIEKDTDSRKLFSQPMNSP